MFGIVEKNAIRTGLCPRGSEEDVGVCASDIELNEGRHPESGKEKGI